MENETISELYELCKENQEIYKNNKDKYCPLFCIDDSLFYHVMVRRIISNSKYLLIGGTQDIESACNEYMQLIMEGIKPICLIDISMVQNGFNLAERLINIDKNVVFILLSEKKSIEYIKRAESINAKGLILKSELTIEKLDELLEKKIKY